MFPDTKLRETSGLIKCFVIFLDFHFNVFQQQQKTGLPNYAPKLPNFVRVMQIEQYF